MLKKYLIETTILQSLNVPVIADKVGGVIGQALVAFGAASGRSCGITLNEQFDISSWRAKKDGERKGGAATRVYAPSLDMQFSLKEAELLFSSQRGKAMLGCTSQACCPRGIADMVANPGRHFAHQRTHEIAYLGSFPETLRPARLVESVRHKANAALKVSNQLNISPEIDKRIEKQRLRLDAICMTMNDIVETSAPTSFAKPPRTRAAREARYAIS